MALDEFLFSKVIRFFEKKKPLSEEERLKIITLEAIKPRLTILARAVTGAAIEIFTAEREGGYRNENFFLPEKMNLFPSRELNLGFYFFRILYLSVQRDLGLNWNELDVFTEELSVQKGVENAPLVLSKLFETYPESESLYTILVENLPVAAPEKGKLAFDWLFGKFMRNEKHRENQKKINHISEKVKIADPNLPQTILKSKAVEEIKSIIVDKKAQEDYVLTHNFEKVETADEFNGSWRDFDGDDDLEDHAEAMSELNLNLTIRTDDMVHSVYQADFTENTNIAEASNLKVEESHIVYDEWDFTKREYLPGFCKVFPKKNTEKDEPYYFKTIKEHQTVLTGMRKMLANIHNRKVSVRKQIQGDDYDLDAITDLFVDIHSKQTPSERIYTSKRKREADLSLLILLDVSLSSDGYTDGNRVIDVEKQVSILFGEILNELNVDFSIHSFYSKTRNYSNFLTLKDFDDSWQQARFNIGSVEPQGFTRIGAALRHAGALLSKRDAKNKWILLLSDGKPNDYDKYEGKHGINDVKQALREINQQNMQAYALAIESQARYYLPKMFGQNHYQILSKPVELLTSMVKLYEKLKSN